MKKRVWTTVLCLGLAAGMAGCADSREQAVTEVTETAKSLEPESETETEEAPESESETASGQTEEGTQQISRVNYYNAEGKLVYYDSYAYYDDGSLASTTLHSVDYLEDGTSYTGNQYTFLYAAGEKILDGLTISDWYDQASGKLILGYDYDEQGNSQEKAIYPEKESIEQGKFGVDASKTEVVCGDAPLIYKESAAQWASVYLREVFAGEAPTDAVTVRFLYVNDDQVPELWLDYGYGAAGGEVFTVGDGTTDKVYLSHGAAYCIENTNRMLLTGGHMGYNYDTVCQIEDGKFVTVAEGTYGLPDSGDVQTDEEGVAVYEYTWDGTAVTEEAYEQNKKSAFDQERAEDSEQNVYTYEQCKRLLQELAEE